MNTDSEVILMALQKERDELHSKIMQVDRIIKRVKSLEYSHDVRQEPVKEIDSNRQENEPALNLFPRKADIKIQVLRVFDVLRQAATLKTIQTEYSRLSGNKYNVRETVRSLHNSGLVRIVKERDMTRGFMWVRTDWIINDQLDNQYKPEGFDLLYKTENLIYE